MYKTCFKCKQKKHISEFYKHSQMKDGHLNKCIECTKKDAINVRNNNIEYYKKYDLIRKNFQHRKENKKIYLKKWRKENQEKYDAHCKINNAIKDGKIIKPKKCQICGITPKILEGHHYNYSKPLDVIWCCRQCHVNIHKMETLKGKT